jgi:hypothetical protein
VLAQCVTDVIGRFATECSALAQGGAAGDQCRCQQEARAWATCGKVACVDKTNGIAEDGRLLLLPP